MSGASFSMSFDDPYQSLVKNMKAAEKTIKDLDAELKEFNKKGEQVTAEYIKRRREAETNLSHLRQRMSSEGDSLKRTANAQNQFHYDIESGNIGGVARHFGKQALSKGGSFLQSKGIKGGAALAGFVEKGGLEAVGKFAGRINPYVQVAQYAGGIFANAFSSDTSALREAKRDAAIALSDLNTSGDDRRVIMAELARKTREAKYEAISSGGMLSYANPVSAMANFANLVEGRIRDERADQIGLMRTRSDIASSGAGGVIDNQSLRDLAERRANRDWAGSDAGGWVVGKWHDFRRWTGFASKDHEEAISGGAKSALAKYRELSDMGTARTMANDFLGAQAAFEKASAEMELTNVRDPLRVWKNNESAHKAHINYVQSHMRLPPVRLGL